MDQSLGWIQDFLTEGLNFEVLENFEIKHEEGKKGGSTEPIKPPLDPPRVYCISS